MTARLLSFPWLRPAVFLAAGMLSPAPASAAEAPPASGAAPAPAFGTAVPPASPLPPEHPDGHPAGNILSLFTEPAALTLEAGQQATFLVTARMADGFERDLTAGSIAGPAESNPPAPDPGVPASGRITLTAPGHLRALAVGSVTLKIQAAGHTVDLPVTVTHPAGTPLSFVRDVLPVLGRQGCNAGACHAKADGQNGFRLTVFSFDPEADYRSIVDGARGRRVFPSDPAESLLLLKATQTLPHEGGARFEPGSEAWRTLADWIGGGLVYQNAGEPALESLTVLPHRRRYVKGGTQQLVVQARYTDGSVRDVTALAQYDSNEKQTATVSEEGRITIDRETGGQAVIVARYMGRVADSHVTVPSGRELPPDQYPPPPVHNFIDELAWPRLRELGLYPSGLCTDAEFLRRASLDAIGLLPTAEEARAFIADPDPDKRGKAIARLLEHPAWADHWGTKWADLLRPNPDRVGVKGVYLLDQWIRENFRRNEPYDVFVRHILTARGNTHRHGPAVIYRDRREPAELTTMFSQLFLGTRLDCAKCHHHPNEKWSQEDFYRLAAYFSPLRQKGGGISTPISGGNETFFVSGAREMRHPVTAAVLHPQPPDGPPAPQDGQADARPLLAHWVTSPDNPFFAKAMVNRIWAQFFGKGIVDPVDDFRLSNPPSHPALLEALAREFVRLKYDGKALARLILESRLYQLSSWPNETNTADTRNFSRSLRRRLAAEVMTDALSGVTGVPTVFPGLPPGSRAAQAWTYKVDSRTMDAFGRPNSSSDCPCERNLKPAISQALHLMNSDGLQEKLSSTAPGALVQELAAGQAPPEEIITRLYLTCYGRFPEADECRTASARFQQPAEDAPGTTAPGPDSAKARRQAIEDILWALLNSAEFVFNH